MLFFLSNFFKANTQYFRELSANAHHIPADGARARERAFPVSWARERALYSYPVISSAR